MVIVTINVIKLDVIVVVIVFNLLDIIDLLTINDRLQVTIY